MTFQTQKNFLSKDHALLQAEFESERLVSIVRLGVAGLFCGVSLFGFLLGTSALLAFIVQVSTYGFIAAYSSYFMFNPGRRGFREYFLYILAFLDVTVITLILWSYQLNGNGSGVVHSSAAGVYFIAIIFSAFHHKASLSLFSGVSAVIGYTILFLTLPGGLDAASHPTDYPVRLSLLIIAAILVTIVSRNNSRKVRQAISSETRYHSLVHRLPEMLFTLDIRGNFVWANMAAASIMGIPAKAIIGRNIGNFLSKPDSMKLDSNGVRGTYCVVDFSGNEKFVDCIIQPVSTDDADGGGGAFDGIMSDVTDREKAIQQREEMVQRLFQYQKMESLGMLASGMAHDFNNILQTVNDLTDAITRESNEESTKRQIELINETMVDARFLVSELFALGRKKPLDFRHVNLNAMLEQIIPHFSKQLGPNFLLALETPEEPLYIEGDPDHLKRVFQNLIGNARDAMPEGGNITVSCEKVVRSASDVIVNIRVSDTGTGIPPELTEKVFDPFFTTKKPGKGTGLGLALVRRIIMLHNGTITIEKTGYEGTVFLIEIPLTSEKTLDCDTKVFMLNRLPASVLLLDDDPKIREVLKIFLKEFKYSVLEATSGDEALKLMKRNAETNLVIMDWKLANEDPQLVIRNLRAINRDAIVMVVSGYPADEKSIAEMKITRWFTKPYDRNLLDIEIQRALHRFQATQADPSTKTAAVQEDAGIQ